VRVLGIRARALQALERDQEALETVEHLAALRPSLQDNFDFLRRRCDLLLIGERYTDALALLDWALQKDRPYAKHPYLRLMRAETMRRLGGGTEEFFAQVKAVSVPSEYESDAFAWFAAAIAMATAQRWSEASDAFERLKQLDARWASVSVVLIFEAMTLNALGRYDDALTRLHGFAEVPRRFAVMASVSEGQALAGLERFAEAITVFDRAITQADEIGGVDSLTLASALTGKANCLIRLKEFTEALPVFDAALQHAERDSSRVGRLVSVSARTGKALALHGLRQAPEALQVLDDAIPLAAALPSDSPFRGLAWWTKAIVLTAADREEDAVQAARRAERAGMPGNEALTIEADALLMLQDYAGSLAAFESAITKAKDDDQRFEALSGKGRALHRLQEFDKAVEAYRKAIDLDCRSAKSDWLIWQRLGEAYDALERPKAALRAYHRGWALQGGGKRSADLALGVTAAWLNLGQPREAVRFLDQAEKLAKADPRLGYNRGLALLRMKDVEGAKQAFRASGSEGLEAAADLLSKLDRKLDGQAAWTECWFGRSASWGKRIVGGTLLFIVALVLAAPVTTFALYGELDWKMLIAPPIVALLLLLLPTMRNVSLSVGDLKLQAEPSSPSVPEQAPDISKLTNVQPLLSGSAASAATYSSGVEEPVRQPADLVPFAATFQITAKVHP
jgi:tetratricopeptide (TPR) repeat protein